MPLIIAAPGYASGKASRKPIELLDLYPTLADLCNLKAPENLEGKSLRQLLTEPNHSGWNKPAVTQIWHSKKAWGYSIRTERYRYTEWLEGMAGRELYDHQTDPDEIHNLADSETHRQEIARLAKMLRPYVQLPDAKRESIPSR